MELPSDERTFDLGLAWILLTAAVIIQLCIGCDSDPQKQAAVDAEASDVMLATRGYVRTPADGLVVASDAGATASDSAPSREAGTPDLMAADMRPDALCPYAIEGYVGPECSPWCAEGSRCLFNPFGMCKPFCAPMVAGCNRLGLGDACTRTLLTGNYNDTCAPGLLCTGADFEGGLRCRRMCRSVADCGGHGRCSRAVESCTGYCVD